MGIYLMSQVIDWFRSNWPYLLAVAGGFVIGWVAKAYLDPVSIPQMPERLRRITEETIEEWRRRGFPEDLIQDAVNWAYNYARGIITAWTSNEDLINAFMNEVYPKILKEAGEHYIVSRIFAKLKEEKLKEILGLWY
jgi:GNAT superfamily N-acetyltransferase